MSVTLCGFTQIPVLLILCASWLLEFFFQKTVVCLVILRRSSDTNKMGLIDILFDKVLYLISAELLCCCLHNMPFSVHIGKYRYNVRLPMEG